MSHDSTTSRFYVSVFVKFHLEPGAPAMSTIEQTLSDNFLKSLQMLQNHREQYCRFLRSLFLHKHSLLKDNSSQLFALSQVTKQLIGALYAFEHPKREQPEDTLFNEVEQLFNDAFDAVQIVKQAFVDASFEQQNVSLATGLTGALLRTRRSYSDLTCSSDRTRT